jgi:DNA-binding transcriptional ArsR family regulator
MALRDWVRLPSAWIEEGGLERLRWTGSAWDSGADCAAALMVLMPIAHYADETTGVARATYGELSERTGLSRAKISAGLTILEDLGVIVRAPAGRSSFELIRFGLKEGWCKFPARRLYTGGRIGFFEDFSLRKSAELNALKLYYLFAARRGEDKNMANISYEKISEYSGLDRSRIKTAISLLAGLGLVHVEHVPSALSNYGISNGYRLAFINSRVHMGTRGRGWDASDFEER